MKEVQVGIQVGGRQVIYEKLATDMQVAIIMDTLIKMGFLPLLIIDGEEDVTEKFLSLSK
jgi:hypothetical protein